MQEERLKRGEEQRDDSQEDRRSSVMPSQTRIYHEMMEDYVGVSSDRPVTKPACIPPMWSHAGAVDGAKVNYHSCDSKHKFRVLIW